MDKRILDIGNARYKINRKALCQLMEQVKRNAATGAPDACRGAKEGACNADEEKICADESLECIFTEVMLLYNEYARCESMDALIRLKCKLEEVSLRYRSLVLAEEVLNINSCLPYERRIPRDKAEKHLQ